MALSRVGKELYEKMFKPYTFKQWAKYPEESTINEVLDFLENSGSIDENNFKGHFTGRR